MLVDAPATSNIPVPRTSSSNASSSTSGAKNYIAAAASTTSSTPVDVGGGAIKKSFAATSAGGRSRSAHMSRNQQLSAFKEALKYGQAMHMYKNPLAKFIEQKAGDSNL